MEFLKQNFTKSDAMSFIGNIAENNVFYPFGVASTHRRQQLVINTIGRAQWHCVMPYIARFRNVSFLVQLAKKLHFAKDFDNALNTVGNFKYCTYDTRKEAMKIKKELAEKVRFQSEANAKVSNCEQDCFPLIYCARKTFSLDGYKKFINKTHIH